MSTLHNDFFSVDFWDSPPFAVNLYHASIGRVFHTTLNLSKVIANVKHDFFDPDSPHFHSPKVQKLLTVPIKKNFFQTILFKYYLIKLLFRKFFSPLRK